MYVAFFVFGACSMCLLVCCLPLLGWKSSHMADIITPASTCGRASSSSAAHRPSGAGWHVLLDYLGAAGLCEQQLQAVQSMLGDIRFRDIDITILRMGGEQQDLTISCHLTAAGLKKLLAGEWILQASSLELTIGSRCLGDSDVIAEFVSSTDTVVHAVVVRVPGASRDRDECTEVNDKISAQLKNLAPYMDAGAHQHLVMLWEQSCQRARESCEAAACALARLSNGFVGRHMLDCGVKETVKAARREVRDAIVRRVQGWHLGNIFDPRKMACVFQRLALDAGCPHNTVSQLVSGARRLLEERHTQQVHGRIGLPAGPIFQNAVALDRRNVVGGAGPGEVVDTVSQLVNTARCFAEEVREQQVHARIGGPAGRNVLSAAGRVAEELRQLQVHRSIGGPAGLDVPNATGLDS